MIVLTLDILDTWTHNGQTQEVPNLLNLQLTEAKEVLQKQQLRMEVLDSAKYNPSLPPLTITEQNPLPGEAVKTNRKIYLTINPSDFRKVRVPNIIQITKRNAALILKSVGLTIGKTTYRDNIGKTWCLRCGMKEKNCTGNSASKNDTYRYCIGKWKTIIPNLKTFLWILRFMNIIGFKPMLDKSRLRIDKYLMNRIENATRNKIQQAAKVGCIFANDQVVKSNYKVKGGDEIKVLFHHPPHENSVDR